MDNIFLVSFCLWIVGWISLLNFLTSLNKHNLVYPTFLVELLPIMNSTPIAGSAVFVRAPITFPSEASSHKSTSFLFFFLISLFTFSKKFWLKMNCVESGRRLPQLFFILIRLFYLFRATKTRPLNDAWTTFWFNLKTCPCLEFRAHSGLWW